MLDGLCLFFFKYYLKSFFDGLSRLKLGNYDFFRIANLFDFDEPCAIFTNKNYVSNYVAGFPLTINDGYAYWLLYLYIKYFCETLTFIVFLELESTIKSCFYKAWPWSLII